jgi:hypothetical protein
MIVLVCLCNFQSYILDNIDNLLRFNNDITVIIDNEFIPLLNKYTNIKIISVESLLDNYDNIKSTFISTFRNGFWQLTSLRFTVLYQYMKIYDIKNIIHIENDILVYKNLDNFIFHDTSKILLTLDCFNRCIPGIMFIPNSDILNMCIASFDSNMNDMQNWANSYKKFPEQLDTLPIFISTDDTTELTLLTKNFKHYNLIFDAAAIGQFLGGIDPRNSNVVDTVGFINETCIIDYSKYKFDWVKDDNYDAYKPCIIIDNNKYDVINLHIHSKNLKKFIK